VDAYRTADGEPPLVERNDYRYVNYALAACYLAAAIGTIAVYRAPLREMALEIRAWYRANQPTMPVSIRYERGKLWDDVREALEIASRR